MVLSYPLPPLQSVVQGTAIQFQCDVPPGCRVQWSVNGVVSKTATYTPSAAPRRHTLKLTCFDAAGLQLSSVTGKLDVTVKAVEPPPPVEEPPPPSPVVEPTPEPEPPPFDLASLPLTQKPSMVYQGAFRLPDYRTTGLSNFGYAGGFAYDTDRGSMFGIGHIYQQMVAEYAIPEIRVASTIAGLARAALLQTFADPTNGKRLLTNLPNTGGVYLGGLLPWREKLIASAYSYYDGNGTAFASHFVTAKTLTDLSASVGPFKVGTAPAGMVGGYMAHVPSAMQALLGGPAVTGQCCLAIIGRTSSGPALFAFNPDDLGAVNPAPATPLVYYPLSNPLGAYGTTNDYHNGATEVTGIAFPNGSRSVLFFGKHGRGTFCYGAGTADETLAKPAVLNPDGSIKEGAICYDPLIGSKGTHAYPYVARVWAYDALDFIEVKDGRKKPWEIKPYAFWDLEFPMGGRVPWLSGASYDPVGNRLFISQPKMDGDAPIVHVFSFA
jgi:hypothetical protein